jgi:hypothetical protein
MLGTGSHSEGSSGHERMVLKKWVRLFAVADLRLAHNDALFSKTRSGAVRRLMPQAHSAALKMGRQNAFTG